MNLLQRIAAYGTLLAATACAPVISQKPLEAEVEQSLPRIHDLLGNVKKLREGEYVVPNDVFRVYALGALMATTGHGYRSNHQRQADNIQTLTKKGYSSEEIAAYEGIVATPNNIILPERMLVNSLFDVCIRHERYHQKINYLLRKWLS